MSKLMETLLYTLDTNQVEASTEAHEAAKESVRAAEQRLTFEEFDNLWNAIANVEHANDLDSFILGFRLGMQLTLEGLKPVDQSD